MRIRGLITGAFVGAALTYLFDPAAGKGRRARLRDQAGSELRRARWRGEKLRRHASNVIEGKMHQLPGQREPDRPMDDATIAQRIRSEVLGRPALDAREIIVDVNAGVARLRGQLDDREQIQSIVEQTKEIPGVLDVESLIHLAGMPAPNKEAARSAARASSKSR
jgi:osmotically-inducible protein OsmY